MTRQPMKVPDLAERLRWPLEQAAEGLARSRAECERRRGEPPRPGEIFLFPETRKLSIMWVVLEHDPAAGRFLAVAADPNLLVGSADVAVPAEAACGALSLRCRFGVRLSAADFQAAKRIGFVESEVLEQARCKRRAIAEGGAPWGDEGEVHSSSLTRSALEEETDRSPEYREWVEELGRAQEALVAKTRRRPHSPAVEAPGEAVDFRPARFPRGGPSPLALAASILLLVSLALAGRVVWQQRELAELGERLTAVEGRSRVLVNVPFAVLRPQDVRGNTETLTVSAGAELVHLILVSEPSYPEYRLEIRERDASAAFWQRDGLKRTEDTGMISVALPRELLPAGAYQLRLSGIGDGEPVPLDEYELEIRE